MKRKIFLGFIFIAFILSCAAEEEKNGDSFGVESITPYFVDSNGDEMRFEFQANLIEDSYIQELSQSWEIEKISLENYPFHSMNSNKKNQILENSINNDFVYETKNDEDGKISALFYKPGYYKVSYSITDYAVTQKKDLILKVGNVEFPELYLSLNIPPEEKDVSNDYIGSFEIFAGNIDVTADYIDIKLAEMKSSWYNSKIKINTTKQFEIKSGISFSIENKEDDTVIKKFVAFSDFIQIQGKDTYEYFNNKEIDITNYPIEVSIKKHLINDNDDILYSTKNPFYFSILNFFDDVEGKSFFESLYGTFDLDKFPYKFEKANKNIISSNLFIGTSGIYFRKSKYTVCFSSDGIISEVVDSDKKRPFPTYPYGYLLGRLGQNGKVFPVGKYFLSDLKKMDNFYIYDIEKKSLEKQN
jgi:hypothetical protein